MPQLYEWSGRALRSELLYEPTPTKNKKKRDPNHNDDNDENQHNKSNEQLLALKQKKKDITETTKTAMISERLENYKMNKQKHLKSKERRDGLVGDDDDEDGGVYHSPDQLARLHRLRRMRKQQHQGGSLSPTSSLDSGKRDGRW